MALSPTKGGMTSVGTGGAFVDDTTGAVFPLESQTEWGVKYGPNGDDFTGSLVKGVTNSGALRGLFNARCTIQRYSEGADDAYGRPAKTWADLSTDVPCRRNVKGGQENWPNEDKTAVQADSVIYFQAGQDVTEQDRIILNSVTYEVLLVDPFSAKSAEHHRRAKVRTVR